MTPETEPTTAPPADARCCGKRHDWLPAGRPLALACQLCPTSPTYWRNQASETATETARVDSEAPA